MIQWDWEQKNNISYTDIEFKDNFLYSVGNFTTDSVTLGGITYFNAGGSDAIICKMDTLGNVIWSQHIASPFDEKLNSVCIDDSNNVLAIGAMTGTLSMGSVTLNSTGSSDVFMIKYSASGTLVLAKQVGTPGYDVGCDITTDYQNNIYVVIQKDTTTLNFAGTNNTYRNGILKWSSGGAEISMQYMRGDLAGTPGSASTTLIKYSAFDSTLIIGGAAYTSSSPFVSYSYCHSSNIGLNFSLSASASWGATHGYYLCKTTLSGMALKIYGCAPSYISGIYDLTVNPNNGDFYFSDRIHWPLSQSDYNHWIKGDLSFSSFVSLPINLSSIPMPASGTFGAPYKINYHDNTLYGLLYQTHLYAITSCSDYYAAKLDLNTNISELKNLDYGQTYAAGVGFNGTFCMGSNNTIGKSCQANCVIPPFSLRPAPDVILCSGFGKQIGFPECFYVKGGTPPFTFSWSPTFGLNATNIPQPQVSGLTGPVSYTLTVTDSLNNIVYDTVNVTTGLNTTGMSLVTACDSYTWVYGWTYNHSGVYSTNFINSVGCDSLHTLNLTIETIDTTLTWSGSSLISNEPNASYQWISCSPTSILPGDTSQSFQALQNGLYAVIITKNGCTDTSACYAVNDVSDHDVADENSWHLYPNPTHTALYIEFDQGGHAGLEVSLLNTMGQIIQQQSIQSNGKAIFDMSSFPIGVYGIRCNGYFRKISKE